MHVVEYITHSNPAATQDLCEKYGMPCDTEEDAAGSLLHISSMDKNTLKEMMDIHPEKDLILELYQDKKSSAYRNASGGCNDCRLNRMLVKTNSADGEVSYALANPGHKENFNLPLQMQTNTLLVMGIISAFVIAMVVYQKK